MKGRKTGIIETWCHVVEWKGKIAGLELFVEAQWTVSLDVVVHLHLLVVELINASLHSAAIAWCRIEVVQGLRAVHGGVVDLLLPAGHGRGGRSVVVKCWWAVHSQMGRQWHSSAVVLNLLLLVVIHIGGAARNAGFWQLITVRNALSDSHTQSLQPLGGGILGGGTLLLLFKPASLLSFVNFHRVLLVVVCLCVSEGRSSPNRMKHAVL